MVERQYENYIIKGHPPPPPPPENGPPMESGFDERVERPELHMLMALTPHMIKGSNIVICQ